MIVTTIFNTRWLIKGVTLVLALLAAMLMACADDAPSAAWEPPGLSGGAMFCPAISPVDGKLMMVNCDMSAADAREQKQGGL